MARFFKEPQPFPDIHLTLVTTVFEFVGDGNTAEFSIPVTATANPTKTVLMKGTMQIEFPDTEEPTLVTSEKGRTFPGAVAIGKRKFTTRALEDDTQLGCVQPDKGYKINMVSQDFGANGALAVPIGYVAFVFGTEYTMNDIPCSTDMVFAVRTTSAVVRASAPCRVVMFNAVPT